MCSPTDAVAGTQEGNSTTAEQRKEEPLLFLFRFQSQFNKKLLQLFVAVVYADLFEAVLCEDFKSIDVQ